MRPRTLTARACLDDQIGVRTRRTSSPADLVDTSIADDGVRVGRHRPGPVGRRLGAAPPRPVRLEGARGSLLEGGHGGPALQGEGVAAVAGQLAIREGPLPGLLEGGERPAAEADVVALAVDREPLHPAPAAAGRDDQVQRRAPAVAVAAGLRQRAHHRNGQPSHGRSPFSHIVYTTKYTTPFVGKGENERKRLECRIVKNPNDYGLN